MKPKCFALYGKLIYILYYACRFIIFWLVSVQLPENAVEWRTKEEQQDELERYFESDDSLTRLHYIPIEEHYLVVTDEYMQKVPLSCIFALNQFCNHIRKLFYMHSITPTLCIRFILKCFIWPLYIKARLIRTNSRLMNITAVDCVEVAKISLLYDRIRRVILANVQLLS